MTFASLTDGTDEELVKRSVEGSRSAFDRLVCRYQDQAVAIARSVLGNFDLAKDAAQNAFAQAYFNLKGFRGTSQFKTWLIRIVINEAKNLRRKERFWNFFAFSKRTANEEGGEKSFLETLSAKGESAAGLLIASERRQVVSRAVLGLPKREREVFVLYYFENFKAGEVSETLGISVGTVKAHLAHGLEKVKRQLRQEGIQDE